MDKRSVFGAIFGSGFSRAYVLGTELALLLATTAWMEPADRGIYVAGYALVKTLTVVSSLSFGQISIHLVGEQGSARLGQVGGVLLLAAVLLPALALLSMSAIGMVSEGFHATYFAPYRTLLAIALPVFLLELLCYSYLTALGRLNSANLAIVGGKTLTWAAILILGFSRGHLGSAEVLAVLVAGQFCIAALYLFVAFAELRRRQVRLSVDADLFVSMLKKAVRLHPSIIGSIVFGGLDVLIAFRIAGAQAASQYQIAVQLLAALSVLPFAIAQFGYRSVAQRGARGAWQGFQKILGIGLGVHLAVAVLSAAVVCMLATDSFRGGAYAEVGVLYVVMVLGAPGLFMSLVMAPFWIGFGYFSATSTLTILTSLVLIPICWSLTRAYGIVGTASAFLAAQLLAVVVNLIFFKHLKRTQHA